MRQALSWIGFWLALYMLFLVLSSVGCWECFTDLRTPQTPPGVVAGFCVAR